MRFLGVLIALSLALLSKAADSPGVSIKKFPAPPVNLFYFDDSETVIVLDPKNDIVYRTTDAGEEWDKVDDIPKGNVFQILPHPFDNKVAIAVGKHKKHWITYDQGEKWTKFETREHPSVAGGGEAFSFHGTDNKRILFHSQEECLLGSGLCIGKVRVEKRETVFQVQLVT